MALGAPVGGSAPLATASQEPAGVARSTEKVAFFPPELLPVMPLGAVRTAPDLALSSDCVMR